MKIALLSEKYTPEIGGLAISTSRLARMLTSAGHSVRVLAPTPSTALPLRGLRRAGSGLLPSEVRTLTHEGITVKRFGLRKRADDTLVDWFELLLKEHQREAFDVIHAYFLTQAGFVAAYAGNYLNLPSVVSARGNDLERAAFDPARASHVLFALQHATVVTTNAHELAKKARAFVPGLEVCVIPNGIDTNHFRPVAGNMALAQQLGINTHTADGTQGTAVIGFVGELREKKGLRALLDGYAQVAKKRPAALLIVGEVRGGEDHRIFDEIQASIPRANIIVTGYVSPADLPRYFGLIDVFAHPSLRDGLPNALLEAMACEKPVVATATGGILEAVTDRKNGLLVPVNDGTALAEAIEVLLGDKDLGQTYARAARETILARFTLDSELEANLNVYRKLGLKV